MTVAPCLHPVHRVGDILRTYLFPLNFPLLYLLTQLGRQSFPAPGAFDGYTLAATAFMKDPASSTRFIVTVRAAD